MKIALSIAVISVGVMLAHSLSETASNSNLILSVFICLALFSIWRPGAGMQDDE